LEVLSFILLFDQGDPFVDLILLQLDFTNVGLIAAETMHGETQNQHQNAESNPNFRVFLFFET
jgi:hypothetical protein